MTATTHDIKAAAVKKAIVLLKSADASYAIIFNDEKHGTLELAKARQRAHRKNFIAKYGYMSIIRSLQPGESVKIPVSHEDLKAMQSTADGAMRKLFGAGSFMTSIRSGRNLEVLRLKIETTAEAA